MNVNLLIDNIVRQTTLLIAQLATASGGRAPLAHVAGQVFLELVKELKAQGLGHKVIADMFGLALRTYHDRVRRLSESATDRGVSLWEAVLEYVRANGLVGRAQLLKRFHADDEVSVRGVLKDLVDSGLLFKSGREDTTTYRAASTEELGHALRRDPQLVAASLLLVMLHQQGPLSVEQLAEQSGLLPVDLRSSLSTLSESGHVRFDETLDAYVADECVIPYGSEHGWEAALFDHYQAMVTAMVNKLRRGHSRALPREALGGSTYHFDLYHGHPAEAEVLRLLGEVRERASQLRRHVDDHPRPNEAESYRVVFYVGQNVIGEERAATPESECGSGGPAANAAHTASEHGET